MKESIKRKNKLYVKSIKFPSLQNIRVYKIYRNKLNSVLCKAKCDHYVPLYKTDDPMLIINYRPVSILPTFSKVFERLMYNRLYAFINDNNILYKYQFGFRQKYATNMALITLVDKIMKSLDNNEYVVGLFLDLSKAFDTVVHDILLQKCNNME